MDPNKIDLEKELSKCKTMEDLTGQNGLLQRLLGGMMEQMLEKEMDEHLGYEKHSSKGSGTGNSRNGKSKKKVRSSYGELGLAVPRDRQGSFEPQLVQKRQRDISSFDESIISMYAKGMSTRDIQDHLSRLYGANISPTTISAITDKVLDVAYEWQSRPLDQVYAVVYLDAIHFKVREEHRVETKAVYTCLGINLEGERQVLGMWIGESEGASFWLGVCSELQQRGVQDILIACMDGLKGLPEALQSVFPKAQVQLCVIHMIRNSLRYIPAKHYKAFIADMKAVYKAPSEKMAQEKLTQLSTKWETKYPFAVRPWVEKWEQIKPYFQYPEDLRRLIYTTNAVEGFHRQLRKATKTKSVFPTSQSLFKMMFLVVRDLENRSLKKVGRWRLIYSSLALLFADRIGLEEEA